MLTLRLLSLCLSVPLSVVSGHLDLLSVCCSDHAVSVLIAGVTVQRAGQSLRGMLFASFTFK